MRSHFNCEAVKVFPPDWGILTYQPFAKGIHLWFSILYFFSLLKFFFHSKHTNSAFHAQGYIQYFKKYANALFLELHAPIHPQYFIIYIISLVQTQTSWGWYRSVTSDHRHEPNPDFSRTTRCHLLSSELSKLWEQMVIN